MVVLSYCGNTQSLLLQKHFLSLEKSMGFLNEVVKEYIDVIRRMKTFTSEYMDLLDCLESDDANSVVFPNQQLEWMEDVLRMFEREVLRKKILVADVEYHDAARLKQMHIQWGSKSVYSNVSHSYGACVCCCYRNPFRILTAVFDLLCSASWSGSFAAGSKVCVRRRVDGCVFFVA